MKADLSLDELRSMAFRAGLNLAEEDLEKLLPGINRSRKQTADLRDLIGDNVEPAGAFSARKVATR